VPVDILLEALGKLLVVLFIVGGIGCLIVIPITAKELIAALLEKDTEEEMKPAAAPES
jgi:hypothetical protein